MSEQLSGLDYTHADYGIVANLFKNWLSRRSGLAVTFSAPATAEVKKREEDTSWAVDSRVFQAGEVVYVSGMNQRSGLPAFVEFRCDGQSYFLPLTEFLDKGAFELPSGHGRFGSLASVISDQFENQHDRPPGSRAKPMKWEPKKAPTPPLPPQIQPKEEALEPEEEAIAWLQAHQLDESVGEF